MNYFSSKTECRKISHQWHVRLECITVLQYMHWKQHSKGRLCFLLAYACTAFRCYSGRRKTVV